MRDGCGPGTRFNYTHTAAKVFTEQYQERGEHGERESSKGEEKEGRREKKSLEALVITSREHSSTAASREGWEQPA